MTIGRVKQSSGRADFYAVAALRAVEPAAVSSNDSVRAAPACFNRIFAHPFVADARAAFAENAALRVVRHNRREIFFRLRVLALGKTLLKAAPIESHLLQLALAA